MKVLEPGHAFLHSRHRRGHKHGHRSARTEISSVVGPVNLQHHPTDQYIGVQRGREFAAIIRENQASVVEVALVVYLKQW